MTVDSVTTLNKTYNAIDFGCTDWMVGPASRGNETIGCLRTEDVSRLNTIHYAASCLAVEWSYMRALTPPIHIQSLPSIPLPPSIIIQYLGMIQISWNFVTIFSFRFCPGHFHSWHWAWHWPRPWTWPWLVTSPNFKHRTLNPQPKTLNTKP